ncbi:MAG: MoaD/ThiS family protein [Deltaproteobacteria bacterium]|nr:MoaD/ThiS family protein [Deltaproteobacteria bacterium]
MRDSQTFKDLQPINELFQVITSPSPFQEPEVIQMRPGQSVGELLAEIQPNPEIRRQAAVSLDGEHLPPPLWAHTRPQPGSVVVIKIVPGARAAAMVLVAVASIVAAAVTMGASAGAELALFGLSVGATAGLLGGLAGMATGIVGNLLVNALIPPARPALPAPGGLTQGQDSPTQFVTGARNQMRPWGTIPRLLGYHRIVPLKMARDVSEALGNDQFVTSYFGQYGPLDITDLRIGDTPIASYRGVTVEQRQGWANDLPITLYTNDVLEEGLSILLKNGVTQVRTTRPGVNVISVDITLPRGAYDTVTYIPKAGERSAVECFFDIAYEPCSLGTGTVHLPVSIFANTTSAVRRGWAWIVPYDPAGYNVYITRQTPDDESVSDGTQVSESYWTALRSFRYTQPVTYPDPLAKIAVKIQASDQLNGTLDEFNFLGKSILPDWDKTTGTWIWRATRNPASCFRAVLQDAACPAPVPDSRINLTQLQYWHEYCETNRWTYSRNVDQVVNQWELLKEIAAAGRAAPCEHDSQWSVILDEPQDNPVTVLNPRTLKDLEVEIIYPDLPHAFRCPFTNEFLNYQADERIVPDDGYAVLNAAGIKVDAWGRPAPSLPLATRYEQLPVPGSTHPDQVFKRARYHMADARLRYRKITGSTNVQNLHMTRGDKILLQHDVMLVGLAAARIKSLNFEITGYDGEGAPIYGTNIIGVTVDELLPMAAGKDYGLTLRVPGETPWTEQVVTDPGEQTTVEFTTPVDSTGTNLAAGDLVTFGEWGLETIPVIVKDIKQSSGMWAKLTCVDEAPDIHLADQGAIPAHKSLITVPYAWNPPVAENIRSDVTVMLQTVNAWQPRILVTLAPWQNTFHPNAVGVEAQYWIADSDGPKTLIPMVLMNAGEISLLPVEQGYTYDFQLRYVERDGTRGQWSESYRHTVVGLSAIPDIANLVSFYRDNRIVLKWDAVSANGYPGLVYEVRKGAAWATAEVLGRTANPEFVTQGDGTYWVAAHANKIYSPNPAAAALTGSNLPVNVLVTHDEYADNWPGTKTSTRVTDLGFLELSGQGLFSAIPVV